MQQHLPCTEQTGCPSPPNHRVSTHFLQTGPHSYEMQEILLFLSANCIASIVPVKHILLGGLKFHEFLESKRVLHLFPMNLSPSLHPASNGVGTRIETGRDFRSKGKAVRVWNPFGFGSRKVSRTGVARPSWTTSRPSTLGNFVLLVFHQGDRKTRRSSRRSSSEASRARHVLLKFESFSSWTFRRSFSTSNTSSHGTGRHVDQCPRMDERT